MTPQEASNFLKKTKVGFEQVKVACEPVCDIFSTIISALGKQIPKEVKTVLRTESNGKIISDALNSNLNSANVKKPVPNY